MVLKNCFGCFFINAVLRQKRYCWFHKYLKQKLETAGYTTYIKQQILIRFANIGGWEREEIVSNDKPVKCSPKAAAVVEGKLRTLFVKTLQNARATPTHRLWFSGKRGEGECAKLLQAATAAARTATTSTRAGQICKFSSVHQTFLLLTRNYDRQKRKICFTLRCLSVEQEG